MSTLVLDTNIVSYLMRGHRLASAYRPHLEGHSLTISFMTDGELYEGAYGAGWGPRRLSKLKETIGTYIVIPFSIEVCQEWGAIRYERRTRTICGRRRMDRGNGQNLRLAAGHAQSTGLQQHRGTECPPGVLGVSAFVRILSCAPPTPAGDHPLPVQALDGCASGATTGVTKSTWSRKPSSSRWMTGPASHTTDGSAVSVVPMKSPMDVLLHEGFGQLGRVRLEKAP